MVHIRIYIYILIYQYSISFSSHEALWFSSVGKMSLLKRTKAYLLQRLIIPVDSGQDKPIDLKA